MNMIFDIQNKWARRANIVFIVVAAVPFLLVIFIVEFIWKMLKSMVTTVKTQVSEAIPTIRDYIDAIRQNW
jgi:F0F1-type ATP synthase membrane subunit b/b'